MRRIERNQLELAIRVRECPEIQQHVRVDDDRSCTGMIAVRAVSHRDGFAAHVSVNHARIALIEMHHPAAAAHVDCA